MANTIQIKRGTGSAVPSGLADGELAINLDSGKLYFGSGSTSVDNFTFGELTAEKYIVSSSVLYVTTSFSSGSTQFGNSADDSHTFTGDVTASGNISASNMLIGKGINIKSSAALPATRFSGNITVNGTITSDTKDIRLIQPVTASGDISSSANIYATDYFDNSVNINTIYSPIASPTFTGTVAIPNIANVETAITANTAKATNVSTNLTATTHASQITINSSDGDNVIIAEASDAIAGVMTVAHHDKLDAIEASADVTDATNVTAAGALMDSELTDLAGVKGVTISTLMLSANTASFAVTSSNVLFGEITASGNISSSGNVYALSTIATTGATNGQTLTQKAGQSNFVMIENGNITASVNISASANIYAADYFDNGANINTLYSPIAGGSGIATVGTIGTGTWQGTDIAVAHGGTGVSTLADNSLLTGTGASPITAEANLTFTGNVLTIGADADIEPQLILANDANTAYLGVANATDDMVTGAADGDLILKSGTSLALALGVNKYLELDGPTGFLMVGRGLGAVIKSTPALASQTAGGNLEILATDATAGNTNKAGGDLNLYAGKSTGNGAPGNISLTVYPAGTSGTSLNSGAREYNISNDFLPKLTTPINSLGIVEHVNFVGDTFEDTMADGDHAGSKVMVYGTDANLTDGQIYFLHTNGAWSQSAATAIATGASQLLGVGNGRTVSSGVILNGFIKIPSTEILNTPGSGAVDGLPVYISTTAGHFDFTAPSGNDEFVRVVGYAIDDDSSDVLVYFNPDNTYVEVTA